LYAVIGTTVSFTLHTSTAKTLFCWLSFWRHPTVPEIIYSFIQELLDSIDGTFGMIPITTTQTYAEFIGIEDKKWFNLESGSTSPPCQERVEMCLAPEPIPISIIQLESLMTATLIFDRAGVNGNARPAQPFNDRVIFPTL
jgi:carbonic anhydrase